MPLPETDSPAAGRRQAGGGDQFDTPSDFLVDINIEATFQDDLIHLTGGFDENQGQLDDGYVYELSAVALVIPEPASLWLLAAAAAAP